MTKTVVKINEIYIIKKKKSSKPRNSFLKSQKRVNKNLNTIRVSFERETIRNKKNFFCHRNSVPHL